MSEMIDRVAEAIGGVVDLYPSRAVARVVIEAMRQPTKAMLAAGAFADAARVQPSFEITEADADGVWGAMIDAVLAE